MEDCSSPASYIRLVHRLIEECMLFNMSKEECMEALSKHANIKPIITSTVWKELEKENKEFFEAYLRNRAETERGSGTEARQGIPERLLNLPPLDRVQVSDANNVSRPNSKINKK